MVRPLSKRRIITKAVRVLASIGRAMTITQLPTEVRRTDVQSVRPGLSKIAAMVVWQLVAAGLTVAQTLPAVSNPARSLPPPPGFDLLNPAVPANEQQPRDRL